MKLARKLTLLSVLMLAAGGSSVALARTHVGVAIGIPLGPPAYYPPPYYSPYYYYPPPVTVVSPPPVYIEQGPAPVESSQEYYWYYCRKPDGYYPYVNQCPAGWERVSPQPPSR